MKQIAPRIVVDARIHFGKPVIRGTRVPVTLVVGKLAAGMTTEQVMGEYGLTKRDVLAALQYAAKLVTAEAQRQAILERVRVGQLSQGRPAEILHVSRQELFTLMSAAGVPHLNYPPADLDRDATLARQSVPRRRKPRGSPAAVLRAVRGLPDLKPGDVDALERIIELGKRPPRAEGIFDAGSRRRR
jgi:uncharacterized protein (DUF433 family)